MSRHLRCTPAQSDRVVWTDRRGWRHAALVVLGVAACVSILTVTHYGATWDEEHSMRHGALFLRWYASGFRDDRVIEESNFRWYGGFFDGLAQIVHHVGFPLYETSHVLTAAFGMAGLALAYWMGAALASRLAGFLATLFLWATPMYYGHSFNNPKDLPFAVMMLASLSALVACWKRLPRLPLRLWLGTGLVFGAALGIRIGGVVNIVYLAFVWVAWSWARWRPSSVVRPGRRTALRDLAASGAKIVAVAWTAMLLCWPYALVHPVANLWQVLRASVHFEDWIHPVRFSGVDVMSNALPWTYVPVWLAVSLPEFYVLAVALAGLQLPRFAALVRGGCTRRREATFAALLALAILLPIATVIATHTILYNGIRHLLFLLPVLAVAAAVCVSEYLARATKGLATMAASLVGLSVLLTALDMIRLHPYESVYFNRLIAGGLPRAAGRFETDYWGQSYREGVTWLMAHYGVGAREPIRVANCSTPFLTGYYLADHAPSQVRFVSVMPDDRPHVVLATTRWLCYDPSHATLLHTVQRMGVPLTYVVELRRPDMTVEGRRRP
jgi:hypothetical protein